MVNYDASAGASIWSSLLWWVLYLPCLAVSSDGFVVVRVGPQLMPFGTEDRYAIFFEGPYGVKRFWFEMLLVFPTYTKNYKFLTSLVTHNISSHFELTENIAVFEYIHTYSTSKIIQTMLITVPLINPKLKSCLGVVYV